MCPKTARIAIPRQSQVVDARWRCISPRTQTLCSRARACQTPKPHGPRSRRVASNSSRLMSPRAWRSRRICIAESVPDARPCVTSQRMSTTSPAITIPQNSSMKSIMTIPPAPQTHHIGCIPQPHSGTRSWASAAPGARAAPDPTSHHLARRNIVGPPLLTSHHEDATIAYGALDRRVWQHRRLHRTCATPVVKPTKYPARGVLHDFVPQNGRIVYVPADLKPSLVAQVERVRALERQTGPIIPYLFPHFAGQHWGERIKDGCDTTSGARR